MIKPPTTLNELKERTKQIAGLTIGELAKQRQVGVPSDLKRQKGWQGQFIESCLGADAGNLSEPDFSLIGVELKTLPIDFSGRVLESTYISVVNIKNHQGLTWENCATKHKLSHVLWVPIARIKDQPLENSRIATPFLWQPNDKEARQLKQDWEEVMDLVALGQLGQLNARMGEILQVRPKAANSRVLTDTTDSEGNHSQTLPRGFYMRPQFTQGLVDRFLKR
ncbi:MAG: DNA mismatch repair endonuclease MutH [Gammaproteobacteria bacterium]|nr:MAG: DNA mismatch repair endonuclease MutH [Gammaproteobacteria bacterium]